MTLNPIQYIKKLIKIVYDCLFVSDQQIQSVDNMEEEVPVDVSEPLSSRPSSTHLSSSQLFFNKLGIYPFITNKSQ